MTTILIRLVNLSISAGYLALAVILVRALFKKTPKTILCLMWGLAAVRLLCPIEIPSVMSLLPSAATIPEDIVLAEQPEIESGFEAIDSRVNAFLTEIGNRPTEQPSVGPADPITPTESLPLEPITQVQPIVPNGSAELSAPGTPNQPIGAEQPNESSSASTEKRGPLAIIFGISTVIAVIGTTGMLLYAAIGYLAIYRKTRVRLHLKENIYLCDDIQSPFAFGRTIYLPSDLSKEDAPYVLAHERAHIKRLDYIWRPLAFFLLAFHWFNPILWVAFFLFCKDMELACDEMAIKDRSPAEKKRYSLALVNCSATKRTISVFLPAFGEESTENRVKNVLRYQKPKKFISAIALFLLVALGACFLTSPIGCGVIEDITDPNASSKDPSNDSASLSLPRSLTEINADNCDGNYIYSIDIRTFKNEKGRTENLKTLWRYNVESKTYETACQTTDCAHGVYSNCPFASAASTKSFSDYLVCDGVVYYITHPLAKQTGTNKNEYDDSSLILCRYDTNTGEYRELCRQSTGTMNNLFLVGTTLYFTETCVDHASEDRTSKQYLTGYSLSENTVSRLFSFGSANANTYLFAAEEDYAYFYHHYNNHDTPYYDIYRYAYTDALGEHLGSYYLNDASNFVKQGNFVYCNASNNVYRLDLVSHTQELFLEQIYYGRICGDYLFYVRREQRPNLTDPYMTHENAGTVVAYNLKTGRETVFKAEEEMVFTGELLVYMGRIYGSVFPVSTESTLYQQFGEKSVSVEYDLETEEILFFS